MDIGSWLPFGLSTLLRNQNADAVRRHAGVGACRSAPSSCEQSSFVPCQREIGDADDCQVISFPSSGWMFASPPFAEAGFGISRVLGSAAPHDTPRIAAVVDQLALPNRVAPRPDRCGLVWNLCARREPAALPVWRHLWPR
jgi:hypothetical protein